MSTSEQHHALAMSNVVTVTCRSVTTQGAGKTIMHALLNTSIVDDAKKYATKTAIDADDTGSVCIRVLLSTGSDMCLTYSACIRVLLGVRASAMIDFF